jgi:hypothetical protein
MKTTALGLCLVMLWSGGGVLSPAQEKPPEDKQTKEDVAAFRKFLEKQYPGKKWQTGPSRVDSEQIQKVYGKQRFYYVFSAPPLPPGANLPEIQDAFRRRLKEFQENFISATVSVDENGKLQALSKPADFNRGLTPIKSDADAKVAAAAVLSLYGADRVGPGVVSPDIVTVKRSDKGWQATADKRNQFVGTVSFDEKGRVVLVSKTYAGPVPP